MARYSRRTVASGRRVQRRKFVWARHSGTFTGTSAQLSRTRLLQEFQDDYGADLIGATLVRVRGVIVCYTADTTAGGLTVAGTVKTDTSAAVDLVNEGPANRPHADWFMWEPFYADGAHDYSSAARRIIDVKSSRKIEEIDEEAYLYIATGPSNPAAITCDYTLSIGLKLP